MDFQRQNIGNIEILNRGICGNDDSIHHKLFGFDMLVPESGYFVDRDLSKWNEPEEVYGLVRE